MILSEQGIVERIDQLLIHNLQNENFGGSCICNKLGLSRTSLYRILKRNTSYSTSLYIRHFRLEQSKGFLLNSGMRISEIAYQVGFRSIQNYNEYFRAEFEICPSQFRKQNNSEVF